MKFNQALLIPALLVLPLASCGSPQRATCEPIPGVTHSYPPPTQRHVGAGRVAAPGPQWLWVQGCWYWNGNDWAWLEQQWMPPGSQMNYVGPPGQARDDYCVFQPNQIEVLPVAMPWPPDIGIGIGYSVQEVVVRGEYGTRHPGGGSYTGGHVRDHRNDPPRRRNEVVPAVRGGGGGHYQPDYDIDEPYLGPGPAASPPAVVSPPSPPRPTRPTAPGGGVVAPPSPPVVATPPRPSAPPQGPTAQPPRRVIHQPPIAAPPPTAPPPRPAPVTRPSAPTPAPARPTPPPRAAPPRAAPRPAQPAQPAAPTRNRSRGR